MKQNTILLGAQWGDEGKGKVVDHLSAAVDYVVRFQGGNNAGHSLWVNGKKTVLRLVPSGILHPHTQCLIGEGVVLDPNVFIEELTGLQAAKVFDKPSDRIHISERAHLILPLHKAVDVAREHRAQGTKAHLGTTGRGIGPCYETKALRRGLRVIDLFETQAVLKDRIDSLTREYQSNFTLEELTELSKQTFHDIEEWKKLFAPMMIDMTSTLREAHAAQKSFLFEGAQGVMLDLDHGTYPYVTSSYTTSSAAGIGAGYPKLASSCKVLGIAKAYPTRVGSGPFPTEMLGKHVPGEEKFAEQIRKLGQEFGAVTGRPRRIGWQDLVALKYAVDVAGIDELGIMKGDVLDNTGDFKVCVKYLKPDGSEWTAFPARAEALDEMTPVYETVKGWKSATPDDPNYEAYLKFIEQFTGVPVHYVGYGPERHQMAIR
jgi:adenylosuccinate synthase